MQKIALTGATGQIGYQVALWLLSRGDVEVWALIRRNSLAARELERRGAYLHLCSLERPDTYRKVLENCQHLIHLAARNTTSTSAAGQTLADTDRLTRTVIEAAWAARIPAVTYVSSVVVLTRASSPDRLVTLADREPDPSSPYVAGKMGAEVFALEQQSQGRDLRIVYPSWVAGALPPDTAILTPPMALAAKTARQGQRFYMDGGISVADAESVGAAIGTLALSDRRQGAYILGGDNVTFRGFFDRLTTQSGHPKPFVPLPRWGLMAAARALTSVLGSRSPVTPAYVRALVGRYSWYDSSPAVRDLGYRIPPAEETLTKALEALARRERGDDRLEILAASLPPMTAEEASAPALLITGYPGWLASRMLELMLTPSAPEGGSGLLGTLAPRRPIRLLVQPGVTSGPTLPDGVQVCYGDLLDPPSLDGALEGVRCVYHLAGILHGASARDLERVNHEGTRHLADACIRKGVRRVLYMSTDSVAGYAPAGGPSRYLEDLPNPRPYKDYGRTKQAGEALLLELTRQGKLEATSLRGFWFFGPRPPARNRAFLRMLAGPVQVLFGRGNNLRSISHQDDLTRAFLLAERSQAAIGKAYWIASFGQPFTVNEIYDRLGLAMGVEAPRRIHVPPFICTLLDYADRGLSWLGFNHQMLLAAGKFHQDIATRDHQATQDFGYEPTVTLEQWLEEARQAVEG